MILFGFRVHLPRRLLPLNRKLSFQPSRKVDHVRDDKIMSLMILASDPFWRVSDPWENSTV